MAVLDKQQAVLVVGVPGVDVASPEMAQALLFQSWCSDMAGPVFTNIREEAGLAYYASSSLFIGMDAGGICFYLGTSPEQLEEAGRRLEKTLEMIDEQGMNGGGAGTHQGGRPVFPSAGHAVQWNFVPDAGAGYPVRFASGSV